MPDPLSTQEAAALAREVLEQGDRFRPATLARAVLALAERVEALEEKARVLLEATHAFECAIDERTVAHLTDAYMAAVAEMEDALRGEEAK